LGKTGVVAQPTNGSGHTGRFWRVGSWCAISILIGITQAIRGVVVDATIFFVVALALTFDGLGRIPITLRTMRRPRATIAIPFIVLVGTVLVLAPRHGAIVTVTMALVGLVVLSAAWAPRDGQIRMEPRDPAVTRAVAWWTIAVVAICLWELAAFIWGRGGAAATYAHPAISDLLDPALDSFPGRLVFFAMWFGLGTALLRPSAESTARGAEVG
jgi:hypothetical protein